VLARAANGDRAHAACTLLALRPDHFIHIGISRSAGSSATDALRSGAHRR
jgi:hypothetical protein